MQSLNPLMLMVLEQPSYLLEPFLKIVLVTKSKGILATLYKSYLETFFSFHDIDVTANPIFFFQYPLTPLTTYNMPQHQQLEIFRKVRLLRKIIKMGNLYF